MYVRQSVKRARRNVPNSKMSIAKSAQMSVGNVRMNAEEWLLDLKTPVPFEGRDWGFELSCFFKMVFLKSMPAMASAVFRGDL
jgi:hypothetical protein